MTKDHKIRICLGGLKGKAREDEMMRLLKRPHLIGKTIRTRMREKKRPHTGRNWRGLDAQRSRPFQFNLKLNTDEYLKLRSQAESCGDSMSKVVRDCIFNTLGG